MHSTVSVTEVQGARPTVPTCPSCERPTHPSESNDDGVCADCLGSAALRPEPVSASSVLGAASLSWSRYDGEHPRIGRGFAVVATHRDDAGALRSSLVVYDLDDTPCVESWNLLEGAAIDETTANEIADDIERSLQSGRGVRYQDLVLEAA